MSFDLLVTLLLMQLRMQLPFCAASAHCWVVSNFSSNSVLGLCSKVLVAGNYSCGFCEKLPEASPVFIGANVSWLLDGHAAGQGWAHQQQRWNLWNNRFKKKKKVAAQQQFHPEKSGVRTRESNSPADTKACEEGGAGGAPGSRALILGVQTMVRQLCPCRRSHRGPPSHGGPLWIRYPSAAHGGPHTGAWGCLKRLWPHGKFVLPLMGGTPHWSREMSVWSPRPGEEGVAVNTTSFPIPLHYWQRGGRGSLEWS